MPAKPADPDEDPRFEVTITEKGVVVNTSIFDNIEEAEAFAEQWTDRVPHAHADIETVSHDHTAWQLVEDDTAVGEDYPRAGSS